MLGASSSVSEPLFEAVRSLRHHLHAHPETGFLERDTSMLLRKLLVEECGIAEEEIRGMAETGLVVDLRGRGAEAPARFPEGSVGAAAAPDAEGGVRIVALRTDIDALPMQERNEHLSYRSTRPGAAHMCGHDGHMACLMGAVKALVGRLDRLPRDAVARLLFQPAEEGTARGGGAEPMVREGCMRGVSEVFGWHNWPGLPAGQLHVVEGPTMARVTNLDITVTGKGVHASQPHAGADAVVAAAAIVTALQTVVSRSVHYKSLAVVSVCTVHGGEARNVLPDTVRMSGTVRTVDDDTFAIVSRRIREIVPLTAEAHGCRAECALVDLYPALVNAAGPVQAVRRAGAAVLGAERVTPDLLPMLGGEDFAFFARERPGCYFFLGSKHPDKHCPMCHASDFDFDDSLVPSAVRMWLSIVEDRLGVVGDKSLLDD